MNDGIKLLLCGLVSLLLLALSMGMTASSIEENKQEKYVQEVVTSNMQCKEYLMKIDDSWSKVVSCERK